MRALRWKSRFKTGDASTDRRKRAFVDCFNTLITAAGQREHCREMDDFMDRLGSDAEKLLQERSDNLNQDFGRRLLASLPLSPFGSNACRECGLCGLAQEKIAEHLEAPAKCLFEDMETSYGDRPK